MIKALVRLAHNILCVEATELRQRENPFRGGEGYFGRNMNSKHFIRVCHARQTGGLEHDVKLGGAYDGMGYDDNDKFSIYFRNKESESLFWQFYSIEKQREKYRKEFRNKSLNITD